jgi:hypothetical protein
MSELVDNFRKSFHNFQNRRGTLSRAVCYPFGVKLPATGRRRLRAVFLRIPPPIGSPVRLGSKRVAAAWVYSSLGNQSEIRRLFIRVEIVSLDFHSTKYFISGFAVCFDIFVMPEHGGVCIVYTVYNGIQKNFTRN